MKRYYNTTTQEWYSGGQSMTRELENGVFGGIPSEEQLTAWGFVEWHEQEPTLDVLLQRAKDRKIEALLKYNQSAAVDSFTISGQQMWLTREERTQIDESINAYAAKGETQMTKYFGGAPFTFPLTMWKSMLNDLIVYASEALNVTEEHKVTINALTSIEDVEAYDFETMYPRRLSF